MGNKYISPWLTHFVGHRDPANDEVNFQTLLSILRGDDVQDFEREEALPGSLHLGKWRGHGGVVGDPGTVVVQTDGSLCEETLLAWMPTCFCDIPEGSLRRHIKHYGAFGLALEKRMLIEQGANPVFYIANDSFVKM